MISIKPRNDVEKQGSPKNGEPHNTQKAKLTNYHSTT